MSGSVMRRTTYTMVRRIVAGTPAPVRMTPSRAPTIAPPSVIGVIADTPIPIPPRVARIPPPRTCTIIEWLGPAEVPITDSKSHIRCAPRSEHRGYILRLDPYLVARHHYIIECRIVCRNIVESITISEIVIARRQSISRRAKSIQATCIGTLIGIRHNRRIVRCGGIFRIEIFNSLSTNS